MIMILVWLLAKLGTALGVFENPLPLQWGSCGAAIPVLVFDVLLGFCVLFCVFVYLTTETPWRRWRWLGGKQ